MWLFDHLVLEAILSAESVHILLVEDDGVDVEAALRAFATSKITNPVTVVGDGLEALDVLRGQNGRERLPRPYIILLDLNMPRMNGIEFLQKIRRDPELKTSVVFVLTTSDNDSDMIAAYNLHVAGYFLKRTLGQQVFDLPQMMQNYWRIVELPTDWQARTPSVPTAR